MYIKLEHLLKLYLESRTIWGLNMLQYVIEIPSRLLNGMCVNSFICCHHNSFVAAKPLDLFLHITSLESTLVIASAFTQNANHIYVLLKINFMIHHGISSFEFHSYIFTLFYFIKEKICSESCEKIKQNANFLSGDTHERNKTNQK